MSNPSDPKNLRIFITAGIGTLALCAVAVAMFVGASPAILIALGGIVGLGRIGVWCDGQVAGVEDMRAIPGARFDTASKQWVAPELSPAPVVMAWEKYDGTLGSLAAEYLRGQWPTDIFEAMVENVEYVAWAAEQPSLAARRADDLLAYQSKLKLALEDAKRRCAPRKAALGTLNDEVHQRLRHQEYCPAFRGGLCCYPGPCKAIREASASGDPRDIQRLRLQAKHDGPRNVETVHTLGGGSYLIDAGPAALAEPYTIEEAMSIRRACLGHTDEPGGYLTADGFID